jgi:CHAT domain-containing protein/Flp pilus assembly protein TadD
MSANARIRCTAPQVLWLALATWCGIGAGAHSQPAVADKPVAAEPPWLRMLAGDDARSVAELEKKLNELRQADQVAEAEQVARRILELRARVQGAEHWQTADARRLVADLKQQERLPAEDRARLREAEALHRRWSELHEAGKFEEALPLARQTVALRRQVLGDAHPATAVSAQDLALTLNAQAKYAEAESLGRQALEVCRKVLGEEHPHTAASYNNLGTTLQAQAKYAQAEALYRRALAIFRQVRGEEHADTATAYDNIGVTLHAQGKYAEAEPFFHQSLTLCRKVLGEEHADTATSYNNLAFNLNAQGKYAEAEPLFRHALVIAIKAQGEEHPDTATGYNNLALNLHEQGRYAAAEPLYRHALALRRKVLGEEHPSTAASYNNLAANLSAQGKYVEAEPLYRRALALLGKRLGEDHPTTAMCYNNLASNLNAQGKHAEAESLHRKALAIRRKVLGEEHPETPKGYNNLAFTLYVQGKHAEAEALFRQALALSRKVLGEEHPLTAANCSNVAAALHVQGQVAEAERFYRQTLAIRRKVLGEDHPQTAISYSNLAGNLYIQGKYAEAETLWQAAARGFEAARLRISFTGLERTAFAAQRSPLLALAACRARAGKATAAWQDWEANLARGLLDDLSARLARPLTDGERQREQEFSTQLQRFDKQIAALAQPGAQSDARRQQAENLHEQRDALLAELSRFEDDLAKKYGPAAGQVYDLARIQAQLPADAALVSWIDDAGEPKAADPQGEHWACLVRQRGAPVWVKLPGSGLKGAWTKDDDGLPAQVQALCIKPPAEAGASWREAIGRLYRQRLAPLAAHLSARDDLPAVGHLVVLPSPALAGVPVEALIEARTDRQPAYTVSYAPSGTMFAWLQEKRKAAASGPKRSGSPRLLALGDPVFTGSGKAGKSLPPLPGTRREVEAIARLFDRADRLLGSAASEQRLEELAASDGLKDYAYLHLATHGVLHAQVALHSALILAQDDLPDPLQQILAGKRAYDGRLTAEQILRSWKLDAELVTLSACQTGLGKYQGGEGYLGFAQALFLAGGRSLVLSLWKVDDNATALLMTRFYQNLLGKRKGLDKPLPKALALQEAKTWLHGLSAKEVDRELAQLPRGPEVERPALPTPAAVHPYAHPYYWGAFILIGDAR